MLHRPASRRDRQRAAHAEAMRRHRRRERDGRGDVAPSFDPIILDRLGGCRDAPRRRSGRCNIVRRLATYFEWRLHGDKLRGDCLLLVGRLGVGFLVGCDCVFVPGLNRSDWRVIQVVEVENYYLAIDNDDPILRQDRLDRENFAGRDCTALAIRVLVVVVRLVPRTGSPLEVGVRALGGSAAGEKASIQNSPSRSLTQQGFSL